jgi:hypothetical protein
VLPEQRTRLLRNHLLQVARVLRHEVLPRVDVALRDIAGTQGLLPSQASHDRRRHRRVLSGRHRCRSHNRRLLPAGIPGLLQDCSREPRDKICVRGKCVDP